MFPYNQYRDGTVFLPDKEGGDTVAGIGLLLIKLHLVQIILEVILLIAMVLLCFLLKPE